MWEQKCIHCSSAWNEIQALGQEKANEFLKKKINSQTTLVHIIKSEKVQQ